MGYNRITKGTGLVGSIGFNSGIITRSEIIVLSAAQILAMFATPVTIVAAPAAGKGLIVTYLALIMTPTATQFASGGAVTFQYSGGAVVHASSIPASVINAAPGVTVTLLAPNTQANGVTVPAATAVTMTNATGAFTTGTGTAKVVIGYDLVPAA